MTSIEGKLNGKPKEKRRSNEKRKEKSRDAARCRRSKETEIFSELSNMLPLRREEIDQLDKASVMRLAIAYLKIHDVLQLFPKLYNEENNASEDKNEIKDGNEKKPIDIFDNNNTETCKLLSQSLDGFLLILSDEGDVTYVSPGILEYLGISKIDMLGQPIWDYIHQCDHDELKEALKTCKNSSADAIKEENGKGPITAHRDLFSRFKCTLTSRGRSVNIKSASYKVIHTTGHVIVNAEGKKVFIAICRPLPHPSNIEIPLGTTTFLTKHSLDMKFTYVDEKLNSLLKYNSDDLIDKSLYTFHHAADSERLMATFKSGLSKGQIETSRYRLLGKYGGYCWLVTQASVIYDKQKPQSVVCVNYVISNIENENEIYSLEQFEASKTRTELNDAKICKLNNENQIQEKTVIQEEIIKPDLIVNKKSYRESSLSPIRRTLNNCSISKGAIEPKRPKSVTASVFTQIRLPTKIVQPNQVNVANDRNTILVNSNQTQVNIAPTAQSVTASIFKTIGDKLPSSGLLPINNNIKLLNNNQQQRSGDMNKGFLSFEDPTELTMLKEEPCIPLDDSTPLFGEMLDGLMLPDSYSSLLQDEITSLDSQNSNNQNCNANVNNKSTIDPFINYRDESCDTNSSPHLLSPGALSKSPEVSSLPSLCSPNSLSQEDEFAFMTMNVDDDIDLSMRAPYIPMNEQDDLPLLPDDIMWGTFSDELKEMKDMITIHDMTNIKNQINSNSNNQNNTNNCYNMTPNSTRTISSAILNNQNCNNNNNNLENMFTTDCDQQGNEIECKKRKFDSNLCDSLDEFEQVFNNKNSSNLDCWSMNDLLSLNDGTSTSVKPQNIIINTAATTLPTSTQTIHIPLIEIQQQYKIKQEQQQKLNHALNSKLNETIIKNKDENCTLLLNNNDNNNILTTTTHRTSKTKQILNPQTTKQINSNLNNNNNNLNVINSTTSPPTTIIISNNIINNGSSNNIGSIENSHKRHINSTISSVDSKRIKNNNNNNNANINNNSASYPIIGTSNLLQQLMAPTPQQQKQQQQQKLQKISVYDKINNKWTEQDKIIENYGNQQQNHQQQQQQQQSSNSVLKNLLVSGCDELSPLPPISIDENSQDSVPNNNYLGQISPCTYYNQPLTSKTVTAQLIKNIDSNPMISGSFMLPSPVFPQLSSPAGSEISMDSGIECNNKNYNNNINTPTVEQANNGIINNIMNYSKIAMDKSGNGEPPPIYQKNLIAKQENNNLNCNNEFTFMTQPSDDTNNNNITNDNMKLNNPFETSEFLMDLCNDDYNMSTNLEHDFLNDDIPKDYNDWSANII